MAEPLPEEVRVVEVGPRDGFQMESEFIPTDLKVEVVDLLSEARLPKIEVSSFVHPRVVPQLADAEEVFRRISRRPGTAYTALVPNRKGAERALDAGADAVRLVVCATETYNQRNVGKSIAESLEDCRWILERATGEDVAVEAVIGVAFGCPFEGEVAEEDVLELARSLVGTGVAELGVADSIGVANPRQVADIMAAVGEVAGDLPLSLHLHNTRGLGLANALAAMRVGIHILDSSLGGLGGCPITTVSTGNIATEDLVNMCHEMDVETGVDLDRVRDASRKMAGFLGRQLPSHVLSAGTRPELFARSS